MKHVILSTDVRVGGTWLGKLFDSHSNVRLLWEPDQHTFHCNDNWFTWPVDNVYVYTQKVLNFREHLKLLPTFTKSLVTHAVHKLVGPMGHVEWVPPMSESSICRQRDAFCRIATVLDPHIIHLLRHPVRWAASVLRWSVWPVTVEAFRTWLRRYTVDAEALAQQYSSNPKYRVVLFEDLVDSTVSLTQELMHWVGLDPRHADTAFWSSCHEQTTADLNPHSHSVFMKKSTVMNRWQCLPDWLLNLANAVASDPFWSQFYKPLVR